MKTVTATILYPVYGVSVKVKNKATDREITSALFSAADDLVESTSITPLIQDCNIPHLNEGYVDEDNI